MQQRIIDTIGWGLVGAIIGLLPAALILQLFKVPFSQVAVVFLSVEVLFVVGGGMLGYHRSARKELVPPVAAAPKPSALVRAVHTIAAIQGIATTYFGVQMFLKPPASTLLHAFTLGMGVVLLLVAAGLYRKNNIAYVGAWVVYIASIPISLYMYASLNTAFPYSQLLFAVVMLVLLFLVRGEYAQRR